MRPIFIVFLLGGFKPKEKQIEWYDGMTPAEFDIYMAQKEAKKARENWIYQYPELRFEILHTQFKLGEIDRATYEQALDNIIKEIEVKV